ncbi:MAG TPA: glycosyltransferase family 39 protein [Rhizobiaceae bacterium]|nr:glycosyltransferase family 39 protein [Rhizobiaceae bacterium]
MAVTANMAADSAGAERLSLARWALLVAVALFAFLPGIASLPPTDRDESRFVQSTKQMVESGDYVDIHLQEEKRYKKPIGIYWLQSLAVAASGQGADVPIWVYRLVSVAAGVMSVLVVAGLGTRMFGANAGLIAGLMLAGILMLGVEARIAKTDATLLALTLIAQAALARVYLTGKAGSGGGYAPWIFWIALGAGILIKGPVPPLLAALTIVTILYFDRERAWLRELRLLPGILVTLLVAAPWLVAITWKNGLAFWQESVGNDLFGKVASGQESHGFPPGYFALIFAFALWPFNVRALDAGLALLGRFRADPRLLFLIAWYVPFWLVFELIPTKLPHYVLPAYPALALAVGWMLTSGDALPDALKSGWRLWLRRANIFGLALVTIALAVGAVAVVPYVTGSFSVWGVIAALLFLAAGWFGFGRAPGANPVQQIGVTALTGVAAIGITVAFVAPALKPVWLSPQIAEMYSGAAACPQSRLVSAGYHEPSLVFLAGTNTLLTDGKAAAAELAKDPGCTIAAVSNSEMDAFTAALPGGLANVEEIGAVEGMNYSKGSNHRIALFRMKK